MVHPTRPRQDGRRQRLGRSRVAALGVAALVGAATATAATGSPTTPDHSVGAVASAPSAPDRIVDETPRPVTVDAELIRSVARQVLTAQERPPTLTDLDLITRDVLAQGPLEAEDVHRVTTETLLGNGPGGPVDTHAAPPPECPPTARACIDVDDKTAWMLTDGRVSYGPVPITTGRDGYETTLGSHRVIRHVRHDHSAAFDSPMPYSTYFTRNGIAFHEGRLDEPSHGCIHMGHHAASHFFENLRVGDEVVSF